MFRILGFKLLCASLLHGVFALGWESLLNMIFRLIKCTTTRPLTSAYDVECPIHTVLVGPESTSLTTFSASQVVAVVTLRVRSAVDAISSHPSIAHSGYECETAPGL